MRTRRRRSHKSGWWCASSHRGRVVVVIVVSATLEFGAKGSKIIALVVVVDRHGVSWKSTVSSRCRRLQTQIA